jgi:hypothetical protein
MRRSTDLIGDSDDFLRVNASVSAAEWTHLQRTTRRRPPVPDRLLRSRIRAHTAAGARWPSGRCRRCAASLSAGGYARAGRNAPWSGSVVIARFACGDGGRSGYGIAAAPPSALRAPDANYAGAREEPIRGRRRVRSERPPSSAARHRASLTPGLVRASAPCCPSRPGARVAQVLARKRPRRRTKAAVGYAGSLRYDGPGVTQSAVRRRQVCRVPLDRQTLDGSWRATCGDPDGHTAARPGVRHRGGQAGPR